MLGSKPYLDLSIGGQKARRYPIGNLPFTIGSADECDLIISHPSVNQRHIVLDGDGERFSAVSAGHIPVLLNGGILSTQILRSGDVLAIDDILELVFRNPIEERERARSQKVADKQGAKPKVEIDTAGLRARLLVPMLILSGMTILMLVIFMVVRDPNRGLPSLTQNSAASVSAAFSGAPVSGEAMAVSLPQCIVNAGARGNMAAWVRVGDTTFWTLANRHQGAADLMAVQTDDDYAALRTELEQLFWEGRRGEAQRQLTLARTAYTKILQLVPDAACSIHVIAASRLNAIGRS